VEWLVTRVLARLFPSRYRVIPRLSDGAPMLRQFKVCRWAYLQSFLQPEGFDLFHVHRWRRMVSFVLSGCFVEERYPGEIFRAHQAPAVYTMDDTVIHRLHGVARGTWSLFLMFGQNRQPSANPSVGASTALEGGGWGYYQRPPRSFVPWEHAIPDERKVGSL